MALPSALRARSCAVASRIRACLGEVAEGAVLPRATGQQRQQAVATRTAAGCTGMLTGVRTSSQASVRSLSTCRATASTAPSAIAGHTAATQLRATAAAVSIHRASMCSAASAAATSEVVMPTWAQLRALAIQAAVPMVGFGIMDQTIMIQAGDLIDSTLGSKLALPTLYAAACGQVCPQKHPWPFPRLAVPGLDEMPSAEAHSCLVGPVGVQPSDAKSAVLLS